MNPAHRQLDYRVRFDWGVVGAEAVGAAADITVVVDVLSFTTTLSVAADLGIEVLPYRWRDDSAARYAAEHDAVLAVGRSAAGPGQVSLSPGTIRAAEGLRRLVLPSPNGSTIAHTLAAHSTHCVGASLRNARAVAHWIAAHPGTPVVAVIAAGERWPDDTLRPAVEDLWGAGAVLSHLRTAGHRGPYSPEAETAIAAWNSVSPTITQSLETCASGRELIASGYPTDVHTAAELHQSPSIPLLTPTGHFTHGPNPNS